MGNLSHMARWTLQKYYENDWSAAAHAITKIHRGTYSKWSDRPGEEFTYKRGWRAFYSNYGVGDITAFELAAFLVSRKMVTFQEAFENRNLPVLASRKRINNFLRHFEWEGPFLLETSLNAQKSANKAFGRREKLKAEKIRLQKRIIAINKMLS